jgi:uncharacterized protein YcgI (DUF1989 family)
MLRITDVEGGSIVSLLCYCAQDPTERFYAADTLRMQGTFFLTTGHYLLSSRAQALLTIVADSYGGHDAIGSCLGSELTSLIPIAAPRTRNQISRMLTRFGLGERDLGEPLNLFSRSNFSAGGSMEMSDKVSRAGDFVELRAERPVLVVLGGARLEGRGGPVELDVWHEPKPWETPRKGKT